MSKKSKRAPAAKPKRAAKKPKTALRAVPRRTPRKQPLPGMEDFRSAKLSRTCASIADVREQKNQLTNTEKDLLGTALAQMQNELPEGVTTYTDHGVELILVHTDKVRVRLVSDNSSSDAREAEQGELADVAAGE